MKEIRKTRSVCPICLENIPANLILMDTGEVKMCKTCQKHGDYSVTVWSGKLDFESWTSGANPMNEQDGQNCPKNCGICQEHESGSCCVLLEVTQRCNLYCPFCFASGGEREDEPPFDELKHAVKDITEKCGKPLVQFSGGEPTLRDDLPELVRYAKEVGCSYTQVNTNGIRLAEDEDYVKQLSEAGLDIVFLQFDGMNDDIYRTLRGRPMLDTKIKAIENCAKYKLGVTLVPTVVSGVNTDNLGDIVRFAADSSPKVRGIHFQPVSYFGRFPSAPQNNDRYTLDMLMADISEQTGISIRSFMPSRCDHPLCGFHSSFIVKQDGQLESLSSVTRSPHTRGTASENREFVAKHWSRPQKEDKPKAEFSEEMDFDTFLYYLRHRSLTISSMAFQDAMNLNIERLRRCSLHVYDNGEIKPFCARYLTKY